MNLQLYFWKANPLNENHLKLIIGYYYYQMSINYQ